MKLLNFFILFCFVSCATNVPGERSPAALHGDLEDCASLVKSFYGDRGVPGESKADLLRQGMIGQKDLKILERPLLLNALAENSLEKEQMEVSFLLIKKKFPHFSEEQILDHYELLKTYCGI